MNHLCRPCKVDQIHFIRFLDTPRCRIALVMSVRDPFRWTRDASNGKDHISAYTMRGVRKASVINYYAVFLVKSDVGTQ